ncbi:MAG: site-2 protease family protein [Chloroflexota bacterium]|nr:site-2 protease family protein [Chloroflexota bacterium]
MLQIFTDARTLILFILTFTVIVAVHEFGHFLTARLLGMRVLEFAFGFPPRVASIVRGGVQYSINAIPVGGFVRILGQDDFAIKQQGEGDPDSFTAKPWWAQAVVLVAGVVMNFILALVVLTAAFALGSAAPTGQVRVIDVKADSPAYAAGIRSGDIVQSVDGRPVKSSQDLVAYTQSHRGDTITLRILRNGRPMPPVTAVPRAEPPAGEGPLGIVLEDVTAPTTGGLPQAAANAWGLTSDIVMQIAQLPGQLISGQNAGGAGAPQIGGPIEIYRVTAQVSQFGVAAVLRLIGVLSINLAILNIIPFPALDGGRLLFVLIGGIFRRRLSPQVEAGIHAVGMVLLLALLVAVSISDLRRAFGG